jgi:hypothetical protein
MPAATFIRSNVLTLLPLLAQQLQMFLDFPPERVIMLRDGQDIQDASFQGDFVVMIRPGGEQTVREQVRAAGRHDHRVDRAITWICWTRLNVDVPGQSYSWLTDPALGNTQFENAVKNCLAVWMPVDVNNNVLAIPGRLSDVAPPVKDRADWGHSQGTWWIQMYLDLAQSPIFPGAI